MDEIEKEERCQLIADWDNLDPQARKELVRGLGLNKASELGIEQRKRARAFLGRSRPTTQVCVAGKARLAGMRVHQETVPGCDHTLVPINFFYEPWHLWCVFCNVEELDSGWHGASWSGFPQLNLESLELAEQIAKAHPALGWTRSKPRAHQVLLGGANADIGRVRLMPSTAFSATDDDDPALADPQLQRDESGFALDSAERLAIEGEAMRQAKHWLEHNNYDVQDTHTTKPYDFFATRDGVDYYVEVKGTTSRGARLFLTRGEVEHVRAHPGQCILIVVPNLRLHSSRGADGKPLVLGAADAMEVTENWSIEDDELQVINYRYKRPV